MKDFSVCTLKGGNLPSSPDVTTFILWVERFRYHRLPSNQREVHMGKYIGYALVVATALFLLEWFQIVDIPFVDLPNLSEQQKEVIEKSEDNMRKRFGD